jgi:4'-phosphopantetheinyl transferase
MSGDGVLNLWLLPPEGLRRWALVGGFLLSPAERVRVAAVQDPDARLAAQGRRAFLRGLLGRVAGLDPAALPLEAAPGGKPRWVGGAWRFNLSASEGWVLLGLSDIELGVDLEYEREFPERRRLWCHFGGEPTAPPEGERRAFFRAWTRLEAALKLHGHGLRKLDDPAARWAPYGLDLDLPAPLLGAVAMARPPALWSLRAAPGPEEIVKETAKFPALRG